MREVVNDSVFDALGDDVDSVEMVIEPVKVGSTDKLRVKDPLEEGEKEVSGV